jgi:hypothetical protein
MHYFAHVASIIALAAGVCAFRSETVTALQEPSVHPAFVIAADDIRARGFPGPVLLPTEGTRFFDGLFMTGSAVVSSGRVDSANPSAPAGITYEVSAGIEQGDQRLVVLEGAQGRGVHDPSSVPELASEDCGYSFEYCAFSPFAQGPPTQEVFTGLMVGAHSALVEHITCCNGEHWSIVWHDPHNNVSYRLTASLIMARLLGADAISPANRAQAEQLAEIATALVAVR